MDKVLCSVFSDTENNMFSLLSLGFSVPIGCLGSSSLFLLIITPIYGKKYNLF